MNICVQNTKWKKPKKFCRNLCVIFKLLSSLSEVLIQRETNEPKVDCRWVWWQNWRTKFNTSTWQCSSKHSCWNVAGLENRYDIEFDPWNSTNDRYSCNKCYEESKFLLILVLITHSFAYTGCLRYFCPDYVIFLGNGKQ